MKNLVISIRSLFFSKKTVINRIWRKEMIHIEFKLGGSYEHSNKENNNFNIG